MTRAQMINRTVPTVETASKFLRAIPQSDWEAWRLRCWSVQQVIDRLIQAGREIGVSEVRLQAERDVLETKELKQAIAGYMGYV